MAKVFDGADGLIDQALGVNHVGTSQHHYQSKKAALLLHSRPITFRATELIEQILTQIHANLEAPQARWREMGGSWENWRWKKNPNFTHRSVVDEKTVEKLIARDCGESWVNQVPTASGLLDRSSETHCNIDLVNKTGEFSYEFIELKYDHATPLFAAFEILKYLALFLVSRERREGLKYALELRPLIWARSDHAIVLGPPDYYAPYSFRWLEQDLDAALVRLSTPDLALRFSFEKMPWPHDSDCQNALKSRSRVYSV